MSTYRHPDPAVRAEMARITAARNQTIDWRLLGHRCLRTVVAYAVIAVAGLITLAVRDATRPLELTRPAEQAQPHPGYRLDIVSPHPTYRKDHR